MDMGELDEQLNIEEVIEKLPYKRIKFAVDLVVESGIPLHLKLLKVHKENIREFNHLEKWPAAHNEQVNASNTVRLLKSDLYQLQRLSNQLIDKDIELFQDRTRPVTEEALEALADFFELYPHVMSRQPKHPDGSSITLCNDQEFPNLVCNFEEAEAATSNQYLILDVNAEHAKNAEAVTVQKRWIKLQNEISELTDLFKKFYFTVFTQKEKVDSIEEHVQRAEINANEGTKLLIRAGVLQSAAPATGAVIGGMLFGPIGGLVGFKLFGIAACALAGCTLGFTFGRKFKKDKQTACDIEMKALTHSSKSLSLSTSDIVQLPEEIIPNQRKKQNDNNGNHSD